MIFQDPERYKTAKLHHYIGTLSEGEVFICFIYFDDKEILRILQALHYIIAGPQVGLRLVIGLYMKW